MKTVSGKIVSTKPVSLSKAANILSNFVTSDNGASQAVAAYLRRASAAFNELAYFKKHHRQKKNSTKSDTSQRSLEEDEVRVLENGGLNTKLDQDPVEIDTREVESKLRKKEKTRKKPDNIEVEGNETMNEKKKKKKRKNAEVETGTPERKRRRTEADDISSNVVSKF